MAPHLWRNDGMVTLFRIMAVLGCCSDAGSVAGESDAAADARPKRPRKIQEGDEHFQRPHHDVLAALDDDKRSSRETRSDGHIHTCRKLGSKSSAETTTACCDAMCSSAQG